jgi:hypothetical protein
LPSDVAIVFEAIKHFLYIGRIWENKSRRRVFWPFGPQYGQQIPDLPAILRK